MDPPSGQHEMPYTVFSTDSGPPDKLGRLDADRARELLEVLNEYSDIVIELAATIVYLRGRGSETDAVDEVKARKPLKATEERLCQALKLLECLGPEAEAPAGS